MSLSCSLFTTCGRDLGSLCYHPLLVCLLRLLNDCWADIGSQEPRSSRSSFKVIAPFAGNTQWMAERERNRFTLSFQVEEVDPEGLELLHGVLPLQLLLLFLLFIWQFVFLVVECCESSFNWIQKEEEGEEDFYPWQEMISKWTGTEEYSRGEEDGIFWELKASDSCYKVLAINYYEAPLLSLSCAVFECGRQIFHHVRN